MKYKRIECKDGFSMSVQAGTSVYSDPRDDVGPYHSVECGFPSVYGWVPVGVVTNVIAKHGGMIGGTVPEGVAPLKGSESD